MIACCKLFASLTFVLVMGAVTWAEENAVPVTEARIAELVKQLDDDDFALREAAVNELIEIGPAAAAPVAQAAQGESLEAATRAFTVLDKWLSGDQPKQVAAREQLGKLAQGLEDNSATRRAKALLTKQQTTPEQPSINVARAFIPGVPMAGVRLGVARVEMRAMAAVAGGVRGRTIAVTIGDGKKTMNVAEGDFKAQIVEDAKEGIKVTVTSKDKAGKEKNTEYAAQTLEELKEKHPEGHKVYEKYASAMNQLKIEMDVGGIVIGGAAQAVEKAEVVPLTKEKIEEIKERRTKLQKLEAEVKVRRAEAEAELNARNEQVEREVQKMRAKLKKQRTAPKAELSKPADEEKKDPLFD